MASFKGLLEKDENGTLCLKVRISPKNPEEFDVPLEELLEDLIDKKVRIDIMPIKSRSEVE
jgi:hypothetical protein